MDNPKISVIVPVYQVEPYLGQCLDSLVAQTYPNMEFILVDDGSPDGCPAICLFSKGFVVVCSVCPSPCIALTIHTRHTVYITGINGATQSIVEILAVFNTDV